MSDPVIVRDGGSGNSTAIVIFGIIIVAALIGLFVWQPWSTHTATDSSTNTTITQPANPNAAAQGGSSTTKSTTTTSGATPGH